MSDIVLAIDGINHTGWKSIAVTLSIESLSGAFQLTMTDKWNNPSGLGSAPQIKPGDKCTLSINGEVLITGYIDAINLSYDANSHSIRVAGRDKVGDLIDCSVIGQSQYKNLKIDEIITRISAPFGVSVSAKVDTGPIVPVFNVEQGSSAFECVQKLCKMRRCLALSDSKGGIVITRSGDEMLATPLIEGQNILSATGDYDFTARFSEYLCKGQRQGTDNLDAKAIAENFAVVKDANIDRYRPILYIAEGQANEKDCRERAQFEASIAQGKSRRYRIVVAGWTGADGKLWTANSMVQLTSPLLGVADSLLIVSCLFRLDDGGELTELELTSREAYLTFEGDIEKGKEGKGVIKGPYLTDPKKREDKK